MSGAAAASPAPRLGAVDAARLVAAFGVIVIHCAPGTRGAAVVAEFFLNACVPFFLLTALFFFARESATPGGAGGAWLRRARRLAGPYLVWTAIYWAAHAAKLIVARRPVGELFTRDFAVDALLLGGSAVHLYFVPLLLLALGWAWLLQRALEKWPALAGPGVLAVVSVAALALLAPGVTVASTGSLAGRVAGRVADWTLWVVPYAIVATWLARGPLAAGGPKGRSAGGWWLLAAAVVDVAVISRQVPYAWRLEGFLVAVGGLIGCARLQVGWLERPAVRGLAACAFGVFLAHHFFLESFEWLDARLGWQVKPYGAAAMLGVSAAVFAVSLGFCLVARRIVPGASRWLGV